MEFIVDDGAGNQLFNVKESKLCMISLRGRHTGEQGWHSGERLASHQCGPGSIPRLGVICGLSLLLVLVLAPRIFLRVLRFSSLLKN